MKNKLSFILTLISVIGVLVLAWFKNTDIQVLLPTILATFILGRTSTNISTVWAASRDPKADTIKAAQMIDSSN